MWSHRVRRQRSLPTKTFVSSEKEPKRAQEDHRDEEPGREDLVKVPTPGASSSITLLGQEEHIQGAPPLPDCLPRSWKPHPSLPESSPPLGVFCTRRRAREPKCQKTEFWSPAAVSCFKSKERWRTLVMQNLPPAIFCTPTSHSTGLIWIFFFFFFFNNYLLLFICLAALVLIAAGRISHCSMWILVPNQGSNPDLLHREAES